MFTTRVVYLSTNIGILTPRLRFNKWFVDNDEQVHETDNRYKNVTHSSWKRINKLLVECRSTTHGTNPTQIWIGFWFDGKI